MNGVSWLVFLPMSGCMYIVQSTAKVMVLFPLHNHKPPQLAISQHEYIGYVVYTRHSRVCKNMDALGEAGEETEHLPSTETNSTIPPPPHSLPVYYPPNPLPPQWPQPPHDQPESIVDPRDNANLFHRYTSLFLGGGGGGASLATYYYLFLWGLALASLPLPCAPAYALMSPFMSPKPVPNLHASQVISSIPFFPFFPLRCNCSKVLYHTVTSSNTKCPAE